ncbi:GDP-L-fucose synthase family protein [Aureibacter tunicatorum]|uniref:GDP-L-fucose synthase n=1 Tax=Aureibacter tunicatorum TaxID=866807 RepID=A0AAE3XPG1_9BACT|nr:GDP-L-fucose synthase [Aureibacter tunicatorum]MDR6239708.1 GDP-L-fucose synthase [Aureibacter tunicatorum]BDD04184.1 GDP-L-fucose synthase [Aureibacter tunicatorum]
MRKHDKIYVAGHNGMVGSALVRTLEEAGYHNLLLRTSKELDLTRQSMVESFFEEEKPDYVFLAAAKVGGIHANDSLRGQFIYDNLMIEANVIEQSRVHGVKKLLFLGSSCIYPKFASQPITEKQLLTGPLEPTNEAYAIAKIAGVKMCQSYNHQYGSNFISVMPTNLYGPNDNYDLESSHVLPALLRKFHEAKIKGEDSVTIWGTGSPKREFLHVNDLADACLFLMNNYEDPSLVNIGTGEDISIKDLALLIKSIVGFEGELKFDLSKPDGTPRKLLSVEKLSEIGFRYKISLEEGIKSVYEDFKDHYSKYSC